MARTEHACGKPTLEVDGAVAVIRLNRPAERNSLRDEDLYELLGMFARVDADPQVRVLLLRADTSGQRRPVFCAGYHVGGFDSGAHDPLLFERIPDALEALRPITVCALEGSVYGGATDLVLACDLRIALAGSEFRMPAALLGLHYYPSGLRRYVSTLGLDLSRRAFLTAQPLPVEELAMSGVFERVVPAADYEAAVTALVDRVASLAPLAAQGLKASLNEIAAGHFDVARLRGREAASLASQDFAEGRAALAERRLPRFAGR